MSAGHARPGLARWLFNGDDMETAITVITIGVGLLLACFTAFAICAIVSAARGNNG